MTTPIVDFLRSYQQADKRRFHMPGHKGHGPLGCEAWDITEIRGADSLYEASGIIARSEQNAAALFGSGATFYSTEGSSQCVRAMLYLALMNCPSGTKPVIAAARNVHKSLVCAAALLDFETVWLWPEEEANSLCSCPITAEGLDRTLRGMDTPPAAVYITSPDYLGGMADVAALAEICHQHGTLFLVDNAHGAYLRFLNPSQHPLDLGADLCCDSAHKTLPVLTGGAYLHIGKGAPECLRENAKEALALFGSTSPSYLTLASLDLCNQTLAGDGPEHIRTAAGRMAALKRELPKWGWSCIGTEPLKLTLDAAAYGWTGFRVAEHFRIGGAELEYADRDYAVLMASGSTGAEEFQLVKNILRSAVPEQPASRPVLPLARGKQALSIREALFAPHEAVPAAESLGRICATPMVSCPPAVPIAVPGERIGREAVELFHYYGVEKVDVLKI